MLKVQTTCLHIIPKNQYIKDLLNITAREKTILSPTWEIVMGIKLGKLNEKEYTNLYTQLMRDSYRQRKKEWEDLLKKDKIILGCYCPPTKNFCHRYIAANILVKLGATYLGEIKNYKEIL